MPGYLLVLTGQFFYPKLLLIMVIQIFQCYYKKIIQFLIENKIKSFDCTKYQKSIETQQPTWQ